MAKDNDGNIVKDPPMTPAGIPTPKLSWKDVLAVKGWPGNIIAQRDRALQVQYPYFEWNGWVYDTPSGYRTMLHVTEVV